MVLKAESFLCNIFYILSSIPIVKQTYQITVIKYLLFAFVFLLIVQTASAQFRFGVTAGPVLSSLVRDNNLSARAGKVGFLIGGVAKLNVGDLGWFFQSGITYTLEGDNDQNLNFVKVPLIIGFDASDDVNIHVAYNLAWQVGNHNNVQDFYNDTANILGVGFEVYLSEKFAIGSRLSYGLSNLVKEPTGAKQFDVKPFTFDLYLTYFFK